MRKCSIAWIGALLGAATLQPAKADLMLNAVGVAVTEDFNDFRGAGFSPTPLSTQLDSFTWRATGFSDGDGIFEGTHTTGDFARGVSNGGVTTGGTYAFQVATGDYALGVQPTGDDFTPGTLTLRVRNMTGQSITGFDLAASAYFFNDEDRSSRWSIAYSVDDVSYTAFPFTLDSVELADATPSWQATPISIPFAFASPVANGDRFYVQLTGNDLAGSGSRDEFAIDNVSITATAVPEPSAAVLLLGLASAGCLFRRPTT